jgi:hypothetical protein
MKNLILSISLLLSPLLLGDSNQKTIIIYKNTIRSCGSGGCRPSPPVIVRPKQQRPPAIPKRQEKKVYWQDFN